MPLAGLMEVLLDISWGCHPSTVTQEHSSHDPIGAHSCLMLHWRRILTSCMASICRELSGPGPQMPSYPGTRNEPVANVGFVHPAQACQAAGGPPGPIVVPEEECVLAWLCSNEPLLSLGSEEQVSSATEGTWRCSVWCLMCVHFFVLEPGLFTL